MLYDKGLYGFTFTLLYFIMINRHVNNTRENTSNSTLETSFADTNTNTFVTIHSATLIF